MKRIFLVIISTAAFMFFSGSEAYSFTDVPEGLGKIMDECVKKDVFSGTILASNEGKTVFERSVGLSDRNSGIKNTNETRYNIASLGKLFTTVMILQLASENKLNLDDRINNYITGTDKRVTIRQLLKHTSGYGDYLNDPEFFQNPSAYAETSELTDLILKTPLLFEPGERFSYSNSGFVLLGSVIEKVTGQKYSENLNKRILTQLGMNNSEFEFKSGSVPGRAIGYIKDLRGKFSDNSGFAHVPTPAGGMYSTAEDLNKFGNSLLNDNRLLTDEFKIIMFNDFNDKSPNTLKELFSDPEGGNAYAGGAPGINSLLLLYPAKKYVVTVLSNYDQAAENIYRNISDLILKGNLILPNPPAGEFLYAMINEKGLEYVKNNFDKILSDNGFKIRDDMMLNMLGYEFLKSGMTDESIFIFRKNAELFPDIANCYDSLGEAYLKKGDRENALLNYTKAVEMNPGNENARQILKSLK
ncbi:MAG: serine hydrolase [Bacteroidetes bacterium]|nr:serine hydrolase [Bacteroidota bacterium]